ncbi:MAG: FAD-dependent oxidoreductase [Eubacteriales bacterium]
MEKLSFSKNLDIRYDVDVFIAGGGPAGCAAAIAAARLGAYVFLAESQGCLGGQGTSGMVPAFMQFGDGKNFLASGIGKEILERMWCIGGDEYKNSKTTSIKLEALKRVYEEMLIEAGAKFLLGTLLTDVVTQENKISYCVLSGKSGMYAVRAKIYIDCTGDADLSAWAGVACNKGDENGNMMAGTLCSLWIGIDWTKRSGSDNQYLKDAIKNGVFENPDLHLPGMWKISERVGGGNIGHTFGVDGTDERSLTQALIYGRKLYDQYEKYYKEYLTGYEKMELVATGAMLGIRETRRICGKYVLVLKDFINQSVFEDEIGRYCYPVDIHASNNSIESFNEFLSDHTGYRYKKGENYEVPYRILYYLTIKT